MKKIIFVLVLTLLYNLVYGQQDVTKFLGIPVDGSKSEMIRKLKEKGFVSDIEFGDGWMKGVFNGHDVRLYVVTNGDKVCRILLNDRHRVDETSIRIRFNNLCYQFKNNSKYISLEDYEISEDEDIFYGIAFKKKRYSAQFYQCTVDETIIQEKILPILLKEYTIEQISDPSPELQVEMSSLIAGYVQGMCEKKSVWFMISEFDGEYYISMYYDNEYNMANGEDL